MGKITDWIKLNWPKYKKYWWIPVIAIVLISGWCGAGKVDRIIKNSNKKIAKYDKQINTLIGENNTLNEQKKKILKEIEELKKNPPIKVVTIDKIKTIVVDKIEYVSKIEYEVLYRAFTLSEEFLKKYQKYVDLDKPIEKNMEKIIDDFEKEKKQLISDRDRLAKLAKRRFVIGIGGTALVDFRGDMHYGLGVFAGYRIK